MARNLPQSDLPDVREYIYVDTDRVQSLLAQMSDGLPDEKATSNSRTSRLRLGMKLGGIETGRDSSESETLSLADLHVSLLEEAATALGLLPDLSERAVQEKFWLRGKVRAQLEPGMLLRITAPTLLVDPNSIMKTLRGFESAIGDDDDDEFGQMLGMVEALYGSAITLSIRPTREEASRSAFVGTIPLDHGFSPLVRDLLLSRIGPDPVQMTSLVQVARIPSAHDDSATAEEQLSGLGDRLTGMSGDSLDRGLLDGVVSQMGGLLEQYGFAAAPRWPAISVVPLALYRHVLPMSALEDNEDAGN